ncbi:serine/threonine-protein kinase [Catenulispora subtropica]|uniref:serine/threonine-protein kinase n=1 Tax=Catenulispora subtropica TaxID=450798 RepID=UPI0031D584DF
MASRWTVPGYEEIRELGAGATGRVVLARHTGSGRPVAIKYLARRLVRESGFLERFRREAETLARLQDPHIVRILDYAESRDGAAIVMEPVSGPTLRGLLVSRGPCPPEVALTVLRGSLLGLGAAHANGVVHRDYKPENVLVDAAGDSKLADFGVAAPAGRDVPGHGTPAYMAPEQWNGMRATPATDMYAATVVFFEMLTGQRPFSSDTMAGLRHAHEAAPLPLEYAPEPVRPLVALGLSKDPDQRYQDVPSFLAHLERVALAGYGADWRERGTRDLAAAVAAMIAAFPLLALGGGGGAAAGGGATGSSAVDAGQAGQASSVARSGGREAARAVERGGGRAGRLGARLGASAAKVKVAAAVFGLAAVATTTTVVVANTAPTGQPRPAAASTPSALGTATTSAGTGTPSPSGEVSTSSPDSPTPTDGTTDSSSTSGATDSSSTSAPSSVGSGSGGPVTTSSSSSSSAPSSSAAPPSTTAKPSTPSSKPPSSGPTTPPTTPSTPNLVPSALMVSVNDPALVGSSSMCAGKGLHVTVTGKISYSGAAPAKATYVWTRSDGTKSATQTVSVSGGSATVTDTFGAGAGGWDQLSVGTVTSSHASYTVNCVAGKLSALNATATGCATTPGNVNFTGTISGTPGSTVRWYWYLAFSTGTPTSAQGEWTNVTLDARGNGAVRFYGWSNFSNTMTGSVMVDPMDGGKPFRLASAVGTLTCR